MQSNPNPGAQVQGALRLLLGLFLIVAFFLPNYTTPILDIDGLDLLRSAVKDPEALRRLTRDMPTFFMVFTPICYWLLGFLAALLGGFALAGRKTEVDVLVMVLAGLVFFLSVITIFALLNRNDTPGFFAKLLPKPGVVFYLTMVAEATLLLAGLLPRIMKGGK